MLATTFDALDEVERRLDTLVAAWTEGDGGSVPRATLRHAGARLATMRRGVRNEQAIFERVGLETEALRDFGTTGEPYFARLDDQIDRLLTSIDAAANAMGMVLDLQLNERAYVLSIVATIFVPLTFVTGFFGMNFGWMVDQVDSDRLLAARVRRSDRDSGVVVASPGAPVAHRRPAVAPLIALGARRTRRARLVG